MKIIGKVDERKYIVEISGDEIANLFGESYSTALPGRILSVGSTIEVSAAWRVLQRVRSQIGNMRELEKSIARDLDRTKDMIRWLEKMGLNDEATEG